MYIYMDIGMYTYIHGYELLCFNIIKDIYYYIYYHSIVTYYIRYIN